MRHSIVFIFIISFIFSGYAQEIEKIDIENHPQNSFPQITLTINNQTVDYFASALDPKNNLKYVKQDKKLSGEIPISGYIFSKEYVESFRITKTLANKKNQKEFVKIFSENSPGKIIDFLFDVNDRKRVAESDDELAKITKKIRDAKTEDDPSSTPYFSTGYIELKSPEKNNERYFIKVSDVTRSNIRLSPDKTKINLLKSISIYSFQNILSSLNFGDIEANSQEDKLYQQLEKTNLSLCGIECSFTPGKDLSQFALIVGKIVTFEVIGNSKIEEMDDFNKYVLAQQWCILKNFSSACHSSELSTEIENLGRESIILNLIKKHHSASELCNFLQK